MNPLAVLIPAVYAALSIPPLLYDELPVRVYEHLPANIRDHYVLLDQPTDSDQGGSRTCRHFSCTLLLDVVTQFNTDLVTSVPAEMLVSQINERLRGTRLNLPTGWDAGPGQLQPGTQLRELDGEYHLLRRLLRYRWEIYYNQEVGGSEVARIGRETTSSYEPQAYR